ncbi:hypothetical protein ACTFIU_004576 [Dictyostelium citrinum]
MIEAQKEFNCIGDSDNQNGVAVIGVGFKIPSDLENCLSSPSELYSALLNEFDGVTNDTSSRWSDNYFNNGDIVSHSAGLLPIREIKSFDPTFFGINPSDTDLIDPQQRLLLKCVWNALEDSGIDPISIRSSDTSVYIGCSTIDYFLLNRNPIDPHNHGIQTASYSISNRISYCFDLRGESLLIDTACSSSLNAIHLGYNSILNSKSKLSIVGGSNLILDPQNGIFFSKQHMNGPSGKCNSFSEEADGFVRSETVGVVVLKSLKDAIKDGDRIYCVIQGSNSNVDGNYEKSNYISPSKLSQAENITKALKSTNGKVNASDIDYFECHGTGTPTGDPIELEGISIALNRTEQSKKTSSSSSSTTNPLLIGSIKSNIGHGEASSGIASLIKCCIMFKYRQFLPNINFKTPNPLIKFKEWNLKVVTKPIPFNDNKQTIMAINNFGVAGSNCCIILSEYKNSNNNNFKVTTNSKSKKFIIPLSSNSSTSLDNYKSLLSNLSNDSSNFQDFVIKQINNKSTSLIQRSAIIASNWDEFNESSNEIQSNIKKSIISNITIKKKNPVTVFVFCGQGSQYNNMALSLYENEVVFKSTMDRLDRELSQYYGYSILEKLRSVSDDDLITIHQPILAIPVNVMVQVSLYELYKHWGIKSDIMVGHSFGEIACSYCSGMVDFKTLCYLTYHRSVAQNKTIGSGKMLSINIGAKEYLDTYSTKYPTIEIACYNSPSSIVIASNNEEQLKEISNELKSKDIFTAMLGSLSAFHTTHQSVIKDDICSLKFKSELSKIPVFSTVTSNPFDHNNQLNSNYLFENVIQPVKFSETISNIYKFIESNDMGNEVTFIEIAPHPTLQYYLNQMKSQQSEYFNNGEKVTIYSACNKKKNDYNEFLKTISTLFVNGYNGINFKSQIVYNCDNNNNNNNINLPLYQWDDNEYYKIHSTWKKANKNGPSINHLGNLNDSSIKSFKTYINTRKPQFQWLKGHSMKGRVVFPGMGYISNILSIYNMNQDITINEIQFKSAFSLVDGVNNCLETSIVPLTKNEFNIKFHFKDLKTNKWVLCANANYNLFKHNQNNTKIDIEKLKSNCNYTKLSKEELYNNIRAKCGLVYKGLFQTVKEVLIGNRCSLAILSLNEIENQQEFKHLLENSGFKSLFNTAILDSCLHGSLQSKEQSQIYFDKCEGFIYYSNNINLATSKRDEYKEIYVYNEINPVINSTVIASLKIMLPDGTLLIEIQKIVCKSATPIIDSTSVIQPSPKDLHTPYYQPKDSIIKPPSSFKHLHCMKEFQSIESDNLETIYMSIYHLMFKAINIRCPTLINLESLETLTLDRFKEFLKDSATTNQGSIQFIYECLKQYHANFKNYKINELEDFIEECEDFNGYNQIIHKSIRIYAKLLFPLPDDDQFTDTIQSLFVDDQLEKVYIHLKHLYPVNNLLSEIVYQSIKPIINQTSTFRILEAGSGYGTVSHLIFDKLEQLLADNFNSSRIDIEYTFTDISNTFLSRAKEKYSKYKRFNIIYKLLDLELPLTESFQDFKPLYYDLVIMSNVLHVVRDINFSTNEIYKVLKQNGQLIFVEPSYKKLYLDTIFGIFPQWWSFSDDIRTDRCCLEPSKWIEFLETVNFRDTIILGQDNKEMLKDVDNTIILVQTRKPSQHELSLKNSVTSTNLLKSYENIIIYTDDIQQQLQQNHCSEIINLLKSLELPPIKIINNIDQFNQFIKTQPSNNNKNNLIIFLKSVNQLNINNYKEITFEFVQINQILVKLELEEYYKLVLITNNSQSSNYLSNSLIGTSRYLFADIVSSRLDITSIDFDTVSIKNYQNVISVINYLLDSKDNYEREYYVINNEINIERYKNESNIKAQLKSKTFQDNKEELMIQLDSNLEYRLKSKPKQELKPTHIEIQVKAIGINYKDYATYSGLIDSIIEVDKDKEKDENYDPNFRNIGNDFSGIVTRIGSGVRKIKIGDEVYGLAPKTSASHIITDEGFICKKPSNISHSEAASSVTVYTTSFQSIYTIGNLKRNETILIHSASGGVGLSALEILKWKNHEGCIFATVGSEEKVKYLTDTYGSFITGIYSSRDKNYQHQIKEKLKSLGYDIDHQGVDLILNTLSVEYMDTNFKCLNQQGKCIDLSITHLTPFDYMDYNKFKFNFSYGNIELVLLPPKIIKDHSKKMLKAFSSGSLRFIPIIEFSNLNIRDAIEYINQRKHIGKIVVKNDVDIINNLFIEQQQQHSIENKEILMKDKYDISNLNLGKNILLTGQTGIILTILKWLFKHSNNSIENIIIISKSKLKWELELFINESIDPRIKILYKQVDVGNNNDLNQCFEELKSQHSINDINSIFHFAFINDIGQFEDVTMNRMDIAHHAKAIGSINLHTQSIERKWDIKQFVLASSAISVFGADNQCCYISACSVLDSLSKYRKSIGLPCLSINFGGVTSTGFVSRSDAVEANLESSIINLITPQSLISSLDLFIQNTDTYSNYTHFNFIYENIASYSLNRMLFKFDYLINQHSSIASNRRLGGLNENNNISDLLISKIGELLSIEPSKLNLDFRLVDYGLDSLVIVQLKNYIDRQFQPHLISIPQLQNNKISTTIEIITKGYNNNQNKKIRNEQSNVQKEIIEDKKENLDDKKENAEDKKEQDKNDNIDNKNEICKENIKDKKENNNWPEFQNC